MAALKSIIALGLLATAPLLTAAFPTLSEVVAQDTASSLTSREQPARCWWALDDDKTSAFYIIIPHWREHTGSWDLYRALDDHQCTSAGILHNKEDHSYTDNGKGDGQAFGFHMVGCGVSGVEAAIKQATSLDVTCSNWGNVKTIWNGWPGSD